MSTNVDLTPELKGFARQCVAEGRYNNVSEVIRSALRLLWEVEEERRQFTAMLDEAMAEAGRDGTFTLESVMAELDAIIDASDQ